MRVLCELLGSRKFWVAVAAVVADLCVMFGADPGKWTHLVMAISGLAAVLMAAIAHEDAAALRQPPTTNVLRQENRITGGTPVPPPNAGGQPGKDRGNESPL